MPLASIANQGRKASGKPKDQPLRREGSGSLCYWDQCILWLGFGFGFVYMARGSATTPAQTLVEVDICQNRVSTGLALSGEDTGVRINSQAITSMNDVGTFLGDNRLDKTGS